MCAATEKVQVEMIHSLAAVFAGIHNHAVAFGQPLLPGYFTRGPEQMTEGRPILFVSVGQ